MAMRTGLRIGEILSHEWSDIDFEERTAEINKSWCYTRKMLGPPKNGRSRKVDLTPCTVEALRKLRKAAKIVSLDGTIFRDERGNRLSYYTLYNALKNTNG
jgi:integrase